MYSHAGVFLPLLITDGEFEALEVTPYSPPPELPDVMKPQEPPHVNTGGEAQLTS